MLNQEVHFAQDLVKNFAEKSASLSPSKIIRLVNCYERLHKNKQNKELCFEIQEKLVSYGVNIMQRQQINDGKFSDMSSPEKILLVELLRVFPDEECWKFPAPQTAKNNHNVAWGTVKKTGENIVKNMTSLTFQDQDIFLYHTLDFLCDELPFKNPTLTFDFVREDLKTIELRSRNVQWGSFLASYNNVSEIDTFDKRVIANIAENKQELAADLLFRSPEKELKLQALEVYNHEKKPYEILRDTKEWSKYREVLKEISAEKNNIEKERDDAQAELTKSETKCNDLKTKINNFDKTEKSSEGRTVNDLNRDITDKQQLVANEKKKRKQAQEDFNDYKAFGSSMKLDKFERLKAIKEEKELDVQNKKKELALLQSELEKLQQQKKTLEETEKIKLQEKKEAEDTLNNANKTLKSYNKQLSEFPRLFDENGNPKIELETIHKFFSRDEIKTWLKSVDIAWGDNGVDLDEEYYYASEAFKNITKVYASDLQAAGSEYWETLEQYLGSTSSVGIGGEMLDIKQSIAELEQKFPRKKGKNDKENEDRFGSTIQKFYKNNQNNQNKINKLNDIIANIDHQYTTENTIEEYLEDLQQIANSPQKSAQNIQERYLMDIFTRMSQGKITTKDVMDLAVIKNNWDNDYNQKFNTKERDSITDYLTLIEEVQTKVRGVLGNEDSIKKKIKKVLNASSSPTIDDIEQFLQANATVSGVLSQYYFGTELTSEMINKAIEAEILMHRLKVEEVIITIAKERDWTDDVASRLALWKDKYFWDAR